MESKKEKGRLLEEKVAEVLRAIDKYARPTRNSGGSVELGDVYSHIFMVECKNWDKKNLIIDNDIWNKLVGQLPIDSKRVPILVQQNNEGLTMVSLKLSDFADIIYKAFPKEE